MKTLLFALVLVLAGCATKSAYQTIAATETAVLAANGAFLDSVVSGKTPTNSVPSVEAAFNDTQMALHAAAVLSAGGTGAKTPPSVAAKAANFTNTVNQIIGKK